MATTAIAEDDVMGVAAGKARIISPSGYNRWLVPPAALAIHLCIGMIYGFSVFWLPMQRLVGQGRTLACPADFTLARRLVTTACDWTATDVTLTFTIAIVLLGSAAAVLGGWLERVGPRRAGLTAAACWGGGLLVAAVGVRVHQLWLVWLGAGVIGGVGLGIGYISPVSTLIRWFPDRRGMATGMAIMGFGGGAMIGAPLAAMMMQIGLPATPDPAIALGLLGLLYTVAMTIGALAYRLPPPGWAPPGWAPPGWAPNGAAGWPARTGMIAQGDVRLSDAHRTRQFWLVWAVLMLNVSAGIGVLSVASPMLQKIFGGRLIGHPELSFAQLDPGQLAGIASVAAGFTGLLSLFNILGRFFWASLSDRIGRRATYALFFVLGIALYAGSPWAASTGDLRLFVGFMCVILSMYGGGFATVPAYLADLFGTRYVGAIHGRLLTAWSTAGVVGPILITQLSAATNRYDLTLYVLAGLLAIGLLCNLLVTPVAARWFMAPLQPDPALVVASTSQGSGGQVSGGQGIGSQGIGTGGLDGRAVLAWAAVGIPIAWGAWITLRKAAVLFG